MLAISRSAPWVPLWQVWTRTYASSFSKKPTWKQKLFEQTLQSQTTISHLDNTHRIFTPDVTKVVDVGYAPGFWTEYAKERLLRLHSVDLEAVTSKCTFVGIDLILGDPIPGVITTQGNIYSQGVQSNVLSLLKEAAFRKMWADHAMDSDGTETSYLLKELHETQLEQEVDELADSLEHLALDEKAQMRKLMGPKMYQADVIMSDLSVPFLQSLGFFNNTYSRPHIRSATTPELRLAYENPGKASIDLAEAALILCFDSLVKGGTFVVRLANVNLADPEIALFQSRLDKVFKSVERWNPRGRTVSEHREISDLFFICKIKRDYSVDKYEVFGVKKHNT